jgi:protein SCO1
MRKISFYISMIVVAFSSCKNKEEYKLPFYASAEFTPIWAKKNDSVLKNIHAIPAFSFTDQNNKIITDKSVEGKIYVADFFFTRCSGICPKMTNNMSKVAVAFMHDSTLVLLSHSVTPEYDDVKALKEYEKKKNITAINWHLLTGSKDDIYSIARTGYFAEMKDGYSKNSNEFLHTENFVLIDKHGRIRGIYNGTLEVEVNDLIDHIKILQKEE